MLSRSSDESTGRHRNGSASFRPHKSTHIFAKNEKMNCLNLTSFFYRFHQQVHILRDRRRSPFNSDRTRQLLQPNRLLQPQRHNPKRTFFAETHNSPLYKSLMTVPSEFHNALPPYLDPHTTENFNPKPLPKIQTEWPCNYPHSQQDRYQRFRHLKILSLFHSHDSTCAFSERHEQTQNAPHLP